jgi:peroxiredoxin Q/BCP
MKLKNGQKAPAFIKNDICGNEINLEKIDNRKILLVFFRYAECALCNFRISEIIQHKQQLKQQDIKFIAVFESPGTSLQNSVANKHQFNFTIIADPNRELYNLYDVKPSWLKLLKTVGFKAIKNAISANRLGFKPGGKIEGAFHQIPADFLIGKDKIIQIAHYGSSVVDHFPLDDIFKFASN